MTLRRKVAFSLVAVAVLTTLPAWAQAPSPPPRTFPQFVGTWVLDEAASTGRLLNAPRVPLTIAITTSATEVTVVKRLRLAPKDNITDSPPPEVYRLDGTQTEVPGTESGIEWEITRRFTLVADMLALTTRQRYRPRGRAFTQVTDALSVNGDLLTLHRQLTSVTASGEILTMSEPTNNFRHTFIYRRQR